MRPLGPTFNVLRKAIGLTQTDVKQASGLTQAFVSKFETGQAEPLISSLIKLCTPLHKTTPADVNMAFFLLLSTTVEDLPEKKKHLFPELQKAQIEIIKEFVKDKIAAQKAIEKITNMPDGKIPSAPKNPRSIQPEIAEKVETGMAAFQALLDEAHRRLERNLKEMPEDEEMLIHSFENEIEEAAQEMVFKQRTAELSF